MSKILMVQWLNKEIKNKKYIDCFHCHFMCLCRYNFHVRKVIFISLYERWKLCWWHWKRHICTLKMELKGKPISREETWKIITYSIFLYLSSIHENNLWNNVWWSFAFQSYNTQIMLLVCCYFKLNQTNRFLIMT